MKIEVSVSRQSLVLLDKNANKQFEYLISTAKNGVGAIKNSECTPLGQHVIRAKIGAGCAANSVFVGRRPTGEIYHKEMRAQFPGRDWILTRILWLSGKEPGVNRIGNVDTMSRYIYIHGTPDDDRMGIPSSRGCVKMRNTDIVKLYDRIPVGTSVEIVA